MGHEEEGLPEEIIREVQVGERRGFEKEVNVIFDKKQAMIRFPSALTKDIGLESGDKFLLRVDKESKPIKIICELIKGK